MTLDEFVKFIDLPVHHMNKKKIATSYQWNDSVQLELYDVPSSHMPYWLQELCLRLKVSLDDYLNNIESLLKCDTNLEDGYYQEITYWVRQSVDLKKLYETFTELGYIT